MGSVADAVDIFNMALDHLEEGNIIQSADEDTAIARRLNRAYPHARDALLQAHPWDFARARKYISAMSTAPAFGWKYQYVWPSDALQILSFRQDGDFNAAQIPYETETFVSDEGNPETSRVQVIMINEPGPLPVRYLARVTDTRLFSPLFVDALAAYLALRIAHSMTGKQSYVERVKMIYEQALRLAAVRNGHQGTLEHARPRTRTWIEARRLPAGSYRA